MSDKIDFRRTLDSYQAHRGEFRVVDVPERRYLMVDGHGDPNTSPAYEQALQSLYPVAYTLKFASKRELGRDYVVPPLEGLWWADDMDSFTTARDKTQWHWTMMILTPDWIDDDRFARAVDAVAAKATKATKAAEPAGTPPPRLHDVRLEALTEGRCVQTLHVGSFDDEAPVLERMHHEIIPGLGLAMTGRHHEIYLSDPRRTTPDKLRTILRQPVG